MERKNGKATIMIAMLLMMTLMATLPTVKAGGTIYIRADGSIDPSNAPISTVDNVTYTFTGDINDDSIVIERDNIVVDGAGYTLQGTPEPYGRTKGIDVAGRSNVTIKNTNIQNYFSGIWLDSSSNNSISGNNITANNVYGIGYVPSIYLGASSGNSISGNKIANNWFGIYLNSSSNFNTISGNNITENNAYAITLDSSSNYNSISGNNITNNRLFGIYLIYSSNFNSISGNKITNNDDGVALSYSSGNSISGNNITANNGNGIVFVEDSRNNSISGNNIANNHYEGIILYLSSNNIVSGNDITANNWKGILLITSSNNSISGNNITASYNYGIWFESSSNYNRVFHNNINNTNQVYSSDSVNVWDDGYPSGGNYWSDYNGVDEKKGLNQDESGSDGIGDTPYVIDETNQDRYPLMNPWTPPPTYDVAITSIARSKTVVGQGYSLNINVTAANQGDYPETFNVTVYANTTSIETKEVTLPIGNSTTITFIWNTTGFAKGNYTISAYAEPVPPGEADTEDNTFIDGDVFVSIPGDVNGDKKVNILDCILIANHFGHVNGDGHTPGSKEWFDCANCDINSDTKTNVLDCIVLSNKFGQSWT